MLRPFLLIGVGGSGGKTLRGIKYQLELKLQQANWQGGIPAAWQFLHFDTPTAQDGVDYAIPFLPPQEYRGLVSSGATYDTVYRSIESAHHTNASVYGDIKRQLPDPRLVKVDVTKGAGQYRAVGRAVALSATKDIAAAARSAIGRMNDAAALAELQTLGRQLRARDEGGASSPTVIVISSVAGGSGAGQFLDVIEVVKSTAKQHPWSNQFFSILYAPDVFDQLNVTAGMPGNALASIAETMNGFWTEAPSDSTLELLKHQGIAPSYGGAMDRVGPAYPFIVGRSNSKVTFADQSEVYNAVATSLTAWITDDRVQDDITAYASGNWQARVGANVLRDESGLMSAVHHSPPFSSLGFGRVTLGREKFLEYSAERLARSSLDRMLYAHTEDDKLFTKRTEQEWIAVKADEAFQRFIRDLRLNEDTDDHNDVTTELRAKENLEQLTLELAHAVQQRLSDPNLLDKNGGLDVSTWSTRLLNEYSIRNGELLRRDERARQLILDDWIDAAPSRILHTVARYVAASGLPVVVELLARVERVLKGVADQLEAEAHNHDQWVMQLPSLVSQELQLAANQNSIRPDQDAVAGAVERLTQALEWASEARLRASASTLLKELRGEFLAPLREHLEGSFAELTQRVNSRRTPDDRENDFPFWPTRNDDTVPRKYTPAPNERLLVEHTQYPREFEKLVRSSRSEAARFDDAMIAVIGDLIVGAEPGRAGDEASVPWSLIDIRRGWKPAVTADAETRHQTQSPRFTVAAQPEAYVERARLWMRREGTPFHAYVTEDLLSFFDEHELTPEVFGRRRDKYREQLQAALGASEPLVKLNPTLLRLVHDKAVNESTSLVFSSIPFKEGTEMYAITKNLLGSMGFWDDATSPAWFQDARVDGIEVFAMSGFPYQPIVMDSVMEPIARGWLAQSGTQDSREAFWKFKKARLLGEAIPADPAVVATMLRGWYVAKALGQLKVESGHGEKGPKLGVWNTLRRAYAWFPHPLLHPRNAQPHDFPGVVMQSLTIALALCNSEESLEPLAAYRALSALGGDRGSMSDILTDWVQSGTLPEGSPEPDPARAGSAGDELADRQTALRDWFTSERAAFVEKVVEHDHSESVYAYPVSWEIREQLLRALDDLTSAVLGTRAADTGI
ncbi:tubulin-like doman-containing protein [Microbacterium sp. P01]|uniref:tubulin-like doman-containing protein n=1 Tax=Microbacterium sp. P01 TaxID=3366261 RepID=UPI00366E905A